MSLENLSPETKKTISKELREAANIIRAAAVLLGTVVERMEVSHGSVDQGH